ncbi:MAG TPA: ATP-binding protein [Mycobacteriales bacterium]|jgi:DNA replication protein
MTKPDYTAMAAEIVSRQKHAPEPEPARCVHHEDTQLDHRGVCPACERRSDEIALRYRREDLDRQISDRFPLRYRHAVADHPEVLEWARQFAEDPKSAPSLLLLGPTGVGKTHQAYGALRAALHGNPTTWKATTTADMLAELRPRTGEDTEAVMRQHRSVWLLLIDDFGVAKNSEWVEEVIYRVINGRYEQMRPTVFTTNLAIPQLRDLIGDRIASRLAEICTRVVLEGVDRRRQR